MKGLGFVAVCLCSVVVMIFGYHLVWGPEKAELPTVDTVDVVSAPGMPGARFVSPDPQMLFDDTVRKVQNAFRPEDPRLAEASWPEKICELFTRVTLMREAIHEADPEHWAAAQVDQKKAKEMHESEVVSFAEEMQILISLPVEDRYAWEAKWPRRCAELSPADLGELARELTSALQGAKFKKLPQLGPGFRATLLRYYRVELAGEGKFSLLDDALFWFSPVELGLESAQVASSSIVH